MKTASHFREDNQAGWVTGGMRRPGSHRGLLRPVAHLDSKTAVCYADRHLRLSWWLKFLYFLVLLEAILAFAPTASASVGPEGELRAILSEAMRENDAIRAERKAIAQENAALSAEVINLRAAQSRTLTKLGELGAQAKQLEGEAEANRESAVKTGAAYQKTLTEAAELHSRLWWWIWVAWSLGGAIVLYVILKLRGLIPF